MDERLMWKVAAEKAGVVLLMRLAAKLVVARSLLGAARTCRIKTMAIGCHPCDRRVWNS